jgi:DNA polymerase-3 subunit beta
MDVLVHPDIAAAVKAMSQGEVMISLDGTMVTVTGNGKAKYTVATLDKEPVDAFPGEDELDWEGVVPIDATDALKVMEMASQYASRKEENPSIIGVNLRVADGDLAVEATDGARLFHDHVALPSPGFPFQEDEVMLPPRMVADLNRVFPDGEVAFAAGDNLFFARDPGGETLFAARRIGGKFPDISRIVPEYENNLVMPRQELADALDRMSGVVRGKPVQLAFEGKELTLSSKTGQGSAEEYVDLVHEAKETKVAFNLEYLMNGVSLFSGDELTMQVKTPLLPVRLTDTGARFFLMAPVKFN